ncbi:MAG: c-type cytochrome [Raineya sp.]|jgi:cytochrome c oxidase cbb3-type subunit 3|nr:c-type cytochrome [Raineya sp.]
MKKKLASLMLLIGVSTSISAQNVTPKTGEEEMVYWILLGLVGLSAAIVILLIIVAVQLIGVLQRETNKALGEKYTIWERLVGFQPKSHEQKLLLDEDFDGIKELDNAIPAWFNWFFGLTVAFALLYFPAYHIWNIADLQETEYDKEVKVAEIKKEEYLKKIANSIDEKNVKLIKDAKQLQKGQELYKANCAVCHGEKGEGKIGPNLTDEYWLYGGSANEVFKTIKYGTNKGMQPWQKQLNPLQIQQVVSFIHTMKGTNPPNAKEPQGKKDSGESTPANTEKAVSMK